MSQKVPCLKHFQDKRNPLEKIISCVEVWFDADVFLIIRATPLKELMYSDMS